MSDRKTVKSSPWSARLTRGLLGSSARLPIPWVRGIGRLLGRVCSWLPNEPRDITRLNLDLCFPDLSEVERCQLARRSLQETGMAAMELGAMWQWPVARLEALEEGIEGEELLAAAMAGGRGTLLLAPHLGNWEFLNHFLMRRAQLVCLYRPPRIAELDAFMLEARGRTGCVSAPATRGGVRRVLRALRSDELVLILPDQEPLKAYGVSAPFFGVPALTMTLVSRILRRTDARALFVFAERWAAGKFKVHFLEAPTDSPTATRPPPPPPSTAASSPASSDAPSSTYGATSASKPRRPARSRPTRRSGAGGDAGNTTHRPCRPPHADDPRTGTPDGRLSSRRRRRRARRG